MIKITTIPRLGFLLRALIKTGGYRSCLVELGLDKNLDDLAAETKERQSSAFEVLQEIEDACSKALALDCGHDWAQFFRRAWFRTREAMQVLSQQVDATPMSLEKEYELFVQQFAVPMLSGFMSLSVSSRGGPNLAAWWASPFQAWVSFASSRNGIAEDELLRNLANDIDADERTIVRWLSGCQIGKLSWPYAPKVAAVLARPLAELEIQLLTGWLLIACAFQSLTPAMRDAVRCDFALRKQQPWMLEQTIVIMNRESFRLGELPERNQAVVLTEEIQQLFASRPHDNVILRSRLDQLQHLIEQIPLTLQNTYQYIHDWLFARYAALLGDKETALRLYESAVSGAWWRAGPNQHPILNEALQYAVGVGDKDAANAYWDKTFMLGLNHGPKRPLDKQEIRRISFGFEKLFHPHKAKDRIPPTMEVRGREDAFCLYRQQLANPNKKTKYAEGRIRKTPLMVAIQEGTLDEVKQLIATGGDPNDCIPESGEGPLSYAMRRACDRKDPIIMDYLLGFDLLNETVNRSTSTQRDTPLKIAVEMANAAAVSRLIELGANVEAPCSNLPFALCYAMTRFHLSLNKRDPTQEQTYFAGKTRADVYDAKEGAVLDLDLKARRKPLQHLVNASERNRQLWDGILDYNIRSPEDYREVIRALLAGGADTNRRYRMEVEYLAEWTPTLCAAEIGDLPLFKMLVEHPGTNQGDPDLTLLPSNSLERFDALWIAVKHGRQTIVSYLLEREKHLTC